MRFHLGMIIKGTVFHIKLCNLYWNFGKYCDSSVKDELERKRFESGRLDRR